MRTLLGAAMLATVLAGAAAAQEVVVDYRDPDFRDAYPVYGPAETAAILARLAEAPAEIVAALGTEPLVLGEAQGSFTAPGVAETVYLLSPLPPVAIHPFPDAEQYLAVFDADGLVSVTRAGEEVEYVRIVGTADPDGDGIDSLLLELVFMHLGIVEASLHAVTLEPDGTPEITQELFTVLWDYCDAPPGHEEIRAAVVVIEDGALAARTETLPC